MAVFGKTFVLLGVLFAVATAFPSDSTSTSHPSELSQKIEDLEATTGFPASSTTTENSAEISQELVDFITHFAELLDQASKNDAIHQQENHQSFDEALLHNDAVGIASRQKRSCRTVTIKVHGHSVTVKKC